jgi:hypothetical protein
MSLRLAVGRQLNVCGMAIIGAGLVIAGSYVGTAGHGFGSSALAQTLQDVREPAQRADLRAGLLHAGSTGADVERVLGHPTVATELGLPGSGDTALLYASEPIRTRVVLRPCREITASWRWSSSIHRGIRRG